MKLKVVLDTNLFVAAYFSRQSASAKIINLCLKDQLQVCASTSLFKELEFILKNIRANIEFKRVVYCIFKKARIVRPPQLWVIKEDPQDNKFLGVAQKSKAHFLITNDRHLLRLGKWGETQIIRPVDFWHVWLKRFYDKN